jgi:hypothetical protein
LASFSLISLVSAEHSFPAPDQATTRSDSRPGRNAPRSSPRAAEATGLQTKVTSRAISSGVSTRCWTSVLSGKNGFSMSSTLHHGTKALFGLLHCQDLPDCGLDAGADYELDQVIHILPGAHDGAGHGDLLNEETHKIGTRIVAGGHPHSDDRPAAAD